MTVTLRDATAGDAAAAARVKVEAFRPIYEPIVHLGFEEDLDVVEQERWLRSLLSDASGSDFFIVAELDGGNVIGWARGEVLGPPSNGGYDALLAGIFVHPDLQRRGVGRALMRECATRFRTLGVTTMKLQTMSTSPSRNFYDRLGGSCVGEETVAEGVVDVIYGWTDIDVLIETC